MIGCIVIALREKKNIEPQIQDDTEEHKGIV